MHCSNLKFGKLYRFYKPTELARAMWTEVMTGTWLASVLNNDELLVVDYKIYIAEPPSIRSGQPIPYVKVINKDGKIGWMMYYEDEWELVYTHDRG